MIQNKKTSANTKLKSTTRTSKKTPAKTTVSLTGGKKHGE
jgi:hypothetical protein